MLKLFLYAGILFVNASIFRELPKGLLIMVMVSIGIIATLEMYIRRRKVTGLGNGNK